MESIPELYIKDIVLTDGSKDYTTSYSGKDKLTGSADIIVHQLSKKPGVKFFHKTVVGGTVATEQFVFPDYPSCEFVDDNKIKVEDVGVYVHLYVDKSLPIKAELDKEFVSSSDNYKCADFEPLSPGNALKDYIDKFWNEALSKSHVVEGNDFIVEVVYLNNSKGGDETVCSFEEAQSSKNLCGGWIKIYYKPKNGSSQSGNNSSSKSKSKCCCKK